MFSTRLAPPIYHHIKAQPEGPRAYVERLVSEDINRTQPGNLQRSAQTES